MFKNFKLPLYGTKSKSALHFGNNGVENIIPVVLESQLASTWAPYMIESKTNKQLSSTRYLNEYKYDLPFPL